MKQKIEPPAEFPQATLDKMVREQCYGSIPYPLTIQIRYETEPSSVQR